MTRHRLLFIALLIWALAMILPDFARVVRPLGSFGFYADSNGLIYDVRGPFESEDKSPAWQAGVRPGDRLDFSRMRCIPFDPYVCTSTITSVGGNEYVLPGRRTTIDLLPTATEGARDVTLIAVPRPTNWFARLVLLLDQFAGIAVILGAGWLVWTRPSRMTWGFFVYVIWYNPGQAYEFYAQLQRWPLLLLVQNALGSISQAVGYAGLLVFVMRAPTGSIQPQWERFEKAILALTPVVAVALMAAYGNSVGFHTELLTRVTILFGIIVSITAVAILLARRRTLSPKDNQRLRWVMWGCLIGLPAFVIADLNEYTTLLTNWNGFVMSEDIAGLLYLLNGVLCLFVVEAVRRDRVVSVAIPLRRVTLLALLMSVPALLLHQQAEHMHELVELPGWSWLGIGALVLFVIGRLHEWSVELADRFFNRALDKSAKEIGEALLRAKTPVEIDRLLSDGVLRALKLSSAATFRGTDTAFRRFENSAGWDDKAVRDLRISGAIMENLRQGEASRLDKSAATEAGFPSGLDMPILAVPAANRVHCFAVMLYGPHVSGTDIDSNEREMLVALGQNAADSYARAENEELRKTIAELKTAPGLQSGRA
ncbi:hypothetical protein [Hyphomicrobium facile]|uniref:Uncharacterized protein n=1 Tax=Hyphomicrobium facile TaxID=51670 RepID=A0A1I7NCH9_9HYPH|nr:hypothetical protein [Hyphomicrobium facile]SFV32362.1 hypothetical protein SAMN04488557_1572 [Hyphomicrobium facile]